MACISMQSPFSRSAVEERCGRGFGYNIGYQSGTLGQFGLQNALQHAQGYIQPIQTFTP